MIILSEFFESENVCSNPTEIITGIDAVSRGDVGIMGHVFNMGPLISHIRRHYLLYFTV
jgi:hypothetical protein